MPITVTCRRCDHEFSAWDDLVGQLVQCPQCKSDVYVGDDDEPVGDEEGEDDDEFTLAPAEESLLSPTSLALPVAGEEEETVDEVEDEVPADCPKCGSDLRGELLCESCGYHVKLRRVLASDVETFKPNENIGFKRWFNSQLAEGESFDTVLFWVKIVFGFMLAVFTLLFFPYSLCITIPIVIGVVAMYLLVKRGPKSGDDAFYDVGSRFTLKLMRALGWRQLQWPFSKVLHYTPGIEFSDQDLADMNNNGEIMALDLEGSTITDAGLVHLADWEQLKYLVLTNTQATQEGVVELQFKLKDTMIWF